MTRFFCFDETPPDKTGRNREGNRAKNLKEAIDGEQERVRETRCVAVEGHS